MMDVRCMTTSRNGRSWDPSDYKWITGEREDWTALAWLMIYCIVQARNDREPLVMGGSSGCAEHIDAGSRWNACHSDEDHLLWQRHVLFTHFSSLLASRKPIHESGMVFTVFSSITAEIHTSNCLTRTGIRSFIKSYFYFNHPAAPAPFYLLSYFDFVCIHCLFTQPCLPLRVNFSDYIQQFFPHAYSLEATVGRWLLSFQNPGSINRMRMPLPLHRGDLPARYRDYVSIFLSEKCIRHPINSSYTCIPDGSARAPVGGHHHWPASLK